MLLIENTEKQEMIDHAENTFPDECCGFLFGAEENGSRKITCIKPAENVKAGDKMRRFEISPLDYLKAERYAEENKLALLGIYHSHPDHPAIPSEYDREAAQPYFSYIILSVLNRKFNALRSWKLNDEFQFDEENVNFGQALSMTKK